MVKYIYLFIVIYFCSCRIVVKSYSNIRCCAFITLEDLIIPCNKDDTELIIISSVYLDNGH